VGAHTRFWYHFGSIFYSAIHQPKPSRRNQQVNIVIWVYKLQNSSRSVTIITAWEWKSASILSALASDIPWNLRDRMFWIRQPRGTASMISWLSKAYAVWSWSQNGSLPEKTVHEQYTTPSLPYPQGLCLHRTPKALVAREVKHLHSRYLLS